MPLFDYRCQACGAVSEVLVRAVGEQPRVACSRCASEDTVRLVSRFCFRPARADKYSEDFREKTLPFLKSRPGAAEMLAQGGASEEARAFELTEQIGQRVDAALDSQVFGQL